MQEGKYINRYEVLFTLAREYTGCDTKGILLSIKKRMHQITDFFRIVEMKKDDLFLYILLLECYMGLYCKVHKKNTVIRVFQTVDKVTVDSLFKI